MSSAEQQDQDMHPITRAEFAAAMKVHDLNLQLAIVKVQKWAMGSVLGTILTVGIGGLYAYTNLISSLESFKPIVQMAIKSEQKLDAHAEWMARKDQHDVVQDQAIQQVNPRYAPKQ